MKKQLAETEKGINNMLNAIQWQALKSGNKEIADIAYSMAQVFRISLSRGRSIISVKQELDLVSYYLSLQKYRLGKKIDYHIDFDEDVLDRQIPKLIFSLWLRTPSFMAWQRILPSIWSFPCLLPCQRMENCYTL